MAWIELHQAVARHPKTYTLAQILSQRRSTIIGMLCLLWLWALDNKTPKVNISPAALADITDWPGDCELLQKAMVSCGWLDVTDEGLVIHDWKDYVGRLLELRESNRKRQEAHRLRLKSPENRNCDITVTSRLRHRATGPNRTQPDRTQPDPTLISIDSKGIDKEIDKEKTTFGEMENITLSPSEYKKLVDRFGEVIANNWVEVLSAAKASKGYKTKSDYATILTWERREREKDTGDNNADPDKYIKGKYGHMVQR